MNTFSSLGSSTVRNSMFSRIRRRSMLSETETRVFKSQTFGWITWVRLKARSWRVSSDERSATRLMMASRSRSGLSAGISRTGSRRCRE